MPDHFYDGENQFVDLVVMFRDGRSLSNFPALKDVKELQKVRGKWSGTSDIQLSQPTWHEDGEAVQT